MRATPSLSPSASVRSHLLAERNLHLLQAIERTLEVLHSDIEIFNIVKLDYQAMRRELAGVSEKIDTDGNLNESLEQAGDLCSVLWHKGKEGHQAAVDDARLLTMSQSASLAVYGEVKRGSHSTEPKAPLTCGGEAPTARSEFFTGTGVIPAYEHYLTAVRSLHDTIEELRTWIGDHDALLEPSVGPVFSDVDAMFRYILRDDPDV